MATHPFAVHQYTKDSLCRKLLSPMIGAVPRPSSPTAGATHSGTNPTALLRIITVFFKKVGARTLGKKGTPKPKVVANGRC